MPASREPRQDLVELAITHERFAADDRDVKRSMRVDEREEPIDKFLALEVADLPQRDVAAEVIVAVGVTARATAGDIRG